MKYLRLIGSDFRAVACNETFLWRMAILIAVELFVVGYWADRMLAGVR